jgi:hypothetical protein
VDCITLTTEKSSRAYRISSLVEAQAVVHGFLQILPRSQISLGGLDGRVAQQELDLLEVATEGAAELGARPPEIVRAKLVPVRFSARIS